MTFFESFDDFSVAETEKAEHIALLVSDLSKRGKPLSVPIKRCVSVDENGVETPASYELIQSYGWLDPVSLIDYYIYVFAEYSAGYNELLYARVAIDTDFDDGSEYWFDAEMYNTGDYLAGIVGDSGPSPQFEFDPGSFVSQREASYVLYMLQNVELVDDVTPEDFGLTERNLREGVDSFIY